MRLRKKCYPLLLANQDRSPVKKGRSILFPLLLSSLQFYLPPEKSERKVQTFFEVLNSCYKWYIWFWIQKSHEILWPYFLSSTFTSLLRELVLSRNSTETRNVEVANNSFQKVQSSPEFFNHDVLNLCSSSTICGFKIPQFPKIFSNLHNHNLEMVLWAVTINLVQVTVWMVNRNKIGNQKKVSFFEMNSLAQFGRNESWRTSHRKWPSRKNKHKLPKWVTFFLSLSVICLISLLELIWRLKNWKRDSNVIFEREIQVWRDFSLIASEFQTYLQFQLSFCFPPNILDLISHLLLPHLVLFPSKCPSVWKCSQWVSTFTENGKMDQGREEHFWLNKKGNRNWNKRR